MLQEPKIDGIRCRKCPCISRYRQGIQKHCDEKQGRQNPRKRGRESRIKEKESIERQGQDLPWVFRVRCQRLFQQGVNSGWFEVDREEELAAESEDMNIRVRRTTEHWLKHVQKKRRETIQPRDESKEPDFVIEAGSLSRAFIEL